jgi:hypothetical protein
MNHDEHLDNILDEALSEYREAEPLAGLEDRVLHRLRLQPEPRSVTWWKWAAVAACAVMLAFAVWLASRPQVSTAQPGAEARNLDVPPQAKPSAHTPRSAPQSPRQLPKESARNTYNRAPTSTATHSQLEAVTNPGGDSPRLPAPLTGEERQLLALAQTHPDALRALSQEDQPIAIAPLNIQPLPSEANPNGDNE